MKYFISDTHFGDTRLNLYSRDLLNITPNQFDNLLIQNWNSTVTKNDTIFHIGDVCVNKEKIELLKLLNGYKILINGNYDEQFKSEYKLIFDEVYDDLELRLENNVIAYMNHFPIKCIDKEFSITGHIHGLWKVQKNMINVGCDAWCYKPISEERVIFTYNAIKKHYDDNVFIGKFIK